MMAEANKPDQDLPAELRARVQRLLDQYPSATTDRMEFLRARFDAGLANVRYPVGLGGLGVSGEYQHVVDDALAAAGAPDNNPAKLIIGLGMAAPTIVAFGTDEQKRRYLRPLWTGEEVWCQLFSEPGAGSDLAALATRAVRDGDDWLVTGQKVWTSGAHIADWAILVARTDPDLPKHQGLTYFLADMHAPGVEVRPLRQLTGEAEFNEVFLTDVRIPDGNRLGAVGEGWKVAMGTLMNERVSIGGNAVSREAALESLLRTWRQRPELRTASVHRELLQLWVDAEVLRLTGQRLRQKLAVGAPGPEGSAMKLSYAQVNQRASALEVELLGADGLRYDSWEMARPELGTSASKGAGFRYLRAKGNSIEGGTSEILRNVIAERVLRLPPEPRTDKDIPWKDVPR